MHLTRNGASQIPRLPRFRVAQAWPRALVRLVASNTRLCDSLNPIGEEEDATVGDFIPETGADGPLESASKSMMRDSVNTVLSTLEVKERQVIAMRFGITDGAPRTLDEVGHYFGVTRERVRQIEARAIRKLRHPTRSRKLRGFLDSVGMA